jgi:uncharacterized protein (DUF2132 family)
MAQKPQDPYQNYLAKTPIQDPLHGITLEAIIVTLHAHFGWKELHNRIAIRCFESEPSVKSSLKFLRKTPWARSKVEALYLQHQHIVKKT